MFAVGFRGRLKTKRPTTCDLWVTSGDDACPWARNRAALSPRATVQHLTRIAQDEQSCSILHMNAPGFARAELFVASLDQPRNNESAGYLSEDLDCYA